ncbi:MAG: C25 family cysteine peptidase [Candidatus Eisenbacteria bacterium]
MRKAILLLALVFALPVLALAASTIVVSDHPEVVSARVVESDAQRTVLEYGVGSFTKTPIDIEGEVFHQIRLEGEGSILKRGFPELPHVARSIVIPDDAEMHVRVVSSHYVDFQGVDVAPSKGVLTRNIDPATVAHSFDPIYETDRWYPSDVAYAREPYIMRDVRGVVVVVNPFQYNPATRTLRVYDRVTLEVSEIGPGKTNVLTRRPATLNTEFRKIYERHFLNFVEATGTRYPPVADAGSMLVICYDDAGFLAAMQPLVDWKNQMGVPCEMVTVTDAGGTADGIRSYVAQYYNDNGVTFVLLVGDAAELPTLTAAGGSSDPSYSTITADMYPELFVGRFSAATVAQVQTQVLRTIEYEKTPQAAATWYHKGMGVASDEGPGDDGEYDNVHIDNIRADLLAFTYTEVDQIYDPTGTAAMVSDGLNDGRSIINYTGHGSTTSWGSTGFSNTQVNALVNDNMLPFIISVACVNGQFTYSTCYAEAWMRATNGTEPTGAIATYMSSINQSWNPPMDAQDEINDLLVGISSSGTRRTFGGLCYNGSGHMMDVYGADGEDMFLTWHIFGDPSLRVMTDSPTALTVTHDANVDAFASRFEVTIDGVEGALAALYHGGVLYGSALTAPSGIATIDILGPLPENTDVTVTVTSFNALTYVGSVHSGGAYVPIISVGPLFFDESMASDDVRVDTLAIDNVGDPLSNLHYDIEVVASGARVAFGYDGRTNTAVPIDADSRAWLEVTSPDGGESWAVGDEHDITWDSGGQTSFIKIEYSPDGGLSWVTIVDGTISDGVHPWVVDAPPTDLCLVRVSMSADPETNDTSGWVFSVFQEINWLSVAPVTGDVPVGSRSDVEVTFDATGLSDGDYYADIIVSNNGGDPVVVPVVLHVGATGVDESDVPSMYVLRGVSPNPFNPVTTVAYGVPRDASVRLAVYSVAGRLVRTLVDGEVGAGYRTVVWDGRDDRGVEVGSGVYFCRMETDGFGDTAKMVLMK